MVRVSDQIRNIFYYRDFRVDDRVPAADGPNGQLTDLQFVANMYRLAGLAELYGGLRVGVERGIRVALEQRRQPGDIDVVGVLMGDQDGGQAGDSLETVREGTGVEEHARVIELGK
jgi:hypothetical protein